MKIKWSVPAVDDLESIRDFIVRDSTLYASSFIEKILKIIDMLEESPKIGREVPEADDPNIHELLFQNYRTMYRVLHDAIHVCRTLTP